MDTISQPEPPGPAQGHELGVFASRDFCAGDITLRLTGHIVTEPTRYTLQLRPGEHLAPRSAGPGDYDSRWCLVNHSCEPNCAVDPERLVLVAQRDIRAGEELTFDYCATEYDMAEPFTCRCGKPGCYGEVRGFKYLSRAQQQRLVTRLAAVNTEPADAAGGSDYLNGNETPTLNRNPAV